MLPPDKNPAAVQRLMHHTVSTKGQFLDRKFLRRQRRTGTLRTSRLWYVDLDTWMASTVSAGGFQAAQEQQQQVNQEAGGERIWGERIVEECLGMGHGLRPVGKLHRAVVKGKELGHLFFAGGGLHFVGVMLW